MLKKLKNENRKIVVVDYPFTNLTQTKIRPAVVAATTDDKYKDVILCLISSVVPHKLNNREILLQPNAINNLRAPSIIKVYRVIKLFQKSESFLQTSLKHLLQHFNL